MDREILLKNHLQNADAAISLRDNPILKEIFEIIKTDLNNRSLSTPTIDKETCADIVRVTQILTKFELIVKRFIDNGKISRMELNKLYEQNKPKLFQRYK